MSKLADPFPESQYRPNGTPARGVPKHCKMMRARRGQVVADQGNMWGEIAGTGLAGGGTGAAGKHGDTSAGTFWGLGCLQVSKWAGSEIGEPLLGTSKTAFTRHCERTWNPMPWLQNRKLAVGLVM